LVLGRRLYWEVLQQTGWGRTILRVPGASSHLLSPRSKLIVVVRSTRAVDPSWFVRRGPSTSRTGPDSSFSPQFARSPKYLGLSRPT
jgi:hypothetical protein